MKSRYRYLSCHEAEEGMKLGAPAGIVEADSMAFTLPAGHVLTDENLAMLCVHNVLFLCVMEADERSDDEVASEAAMATQRLKQIFTGADLADRHTSALIKQVFRYRTAPCPPH